MLILDKCLWWQKPVCAWNNGLFVKGSISLTHTKLESGIAGHSLKRLVNGFQHYTSIAVLYSIRVWFFNNPCKNLIWKWLNVQGCVRGKIFKKEIFKMLIMDKCLSWQKPVCAWNNGRFLQGSISLTHNKLESGIAGHSLKKCVNCFQHKNIITIENNWK